MAVNKYFVNTNGTLTEQLAPATSAGAVDAGKIPALGATGTLDNSFLPPGIGADTQVLTSSETLPAGAYVNVHNVAGNFRARLADGTTAGKLVDGFVRAAFASGAAATIYFEGTNDAVTGQVPGEVFLSTTPGAGSSTAPAASGNVVQRIGIATSATTVNFQKQVPYVLA
jgi:hypothetical protein